MKHLRLSRYFTDELANPAPAVQNMENPLFDIHGAIGVHIDSTIIPTVQSAIEIFGGVTVRAALPLAARYAFAHRHMGCLLEVAGDGPETIPGSWMETPLFIHGYRTQPDGHVNFFCAFGHTIVEITEDFWMYNDMRTPYTGGPTYGPYIGIEGLVLIPRSMQSIPGFDLDKLKADNENLRDAVPLRSV
jgi:hypothetical protein